MHLVLFLRVALCNTPQMYAHIMHLHMLTQYIVHIYNSRAALQAAAYAALLRRCVSMLLYTLCKWQQQITKELVRSSQHVLEPDL